MESAALDLVASLLDMRVADPSGSISRLPRRHRAAVDDAIDILREEFDAPHSIASLASRTGLNQCYLKAAFRAVTGTTIARYLRDLRMYQARAMIENSRHSIQETALFVGYANPSHFAAAFRKVHGMAPSELR
jgi:AraC-like DNA-binding protein